MKKNPTAIIAALAAFILGFAVSWLIKPAEVRIVEVPVQTQAPSQQTAEPSQPEQQPSQQTAEPSQPEQPEQQTTEPSQPEQQQQAPTPSQGSSEGVTVDGDRARDSIYDVEVTRDGTYSSKYEVALYINAFDSLPSNFISKTKAKKAGWVSNKGNLWDVLPGMSIGGGSFLNLEGQLPLDHDPDRQLFECDINYRGGYRGAERLVYSDDGYIFYTGDHYKTFEQLYPHEGA